MLDARFEAAAAEGFRAVEIQFPYALTPARLHEQLRAGGVHLVLFNAPPATLREASGGWPGCPGGRRSSARASPARWNTRPPVHAIAST